MSTQVITLNATTKTTTSDTTDLQTWAGLRVLLTVYLVVSIHMTAVALLGGMDRVYFAVFGACQYGPALVVLALAPRWRRRLAQLLSTVPAARWLVGGYLASAVVLGLCVMVPYLAGYRAMNLGSEVWDHYPLGWLVPAAVRAEVGYLPFIVLAAPLLHLLNATGEEIFWRGYLLDWLEAHLPRRLAWLANGVLWGLWHAPMIVLVGWDFPGQPVLGILAIVGSQVFWSVVLCWVTRRTGSLWPAIVMHAAANALTIGLYDRLIDHDYNLLFSPWGLLGGALMALAAVPLLLTTRTTTRPEGAVS
jgi:membrane protease YdiL (CAAX protease family)